MQPNLFNETEKKTHNKNTPLAYKNRPDSFESFFGQDEIKKHFQNTQLENLQHSIFYGPPGTGKTSLVNIIVKKLDAHCSTYNAVLGNIADLRKEISNLNSVSATSKKTILFIDEIHRLSKAAQDALLPYLEDGSFTLLGATTESPYHFAIAALKSRVSFYKFHPLTKREIYSILKPSLESKVTDEILKLISFHAKGDARMGFNLGEICINQKIDTKDKFEQELSKQEMYLYRDENKRYDVISAFIKSIRGSDPNASVLYLAILIEMNEDIVYIARRLVILASEDIGNANPNALILANACLESIQTIGMPESRIILSQAVTYLASSPKSNKSYLAINKAIDYVRQNPTIEIPHYLKNSHPEKKNYLYPHTSEDHFIRQKYTTSPIPSFYQPSKNGEEKEISDYLSKSWD